MTPIRVLVADDYSLVRAGVRALLRGLPGVEVVGEAGVARHPKPVPAYHVDSEHPHG